MYSLFSKLPFIVETGCYRWVISDNGGTLFDIHHSNYISYRILTSSTCTVLHITIVKLLALTFDPLATIIFTNSLETILTHFFVMYLQY